MALALHCWVINFRLWSCPHQERMAVHEVHCLLLSRAERLSGLMDENRARLAERGEKLRGLQDKTERMESDAADFASMARQLREREEGKKWWQL